MMRDEAATDEARDIARRQTWPGELPKFAAVVAAQPGVPDDLRHHGEAALDVRRREALPSRRRLDAVRISVLYLMLEAREHLVRRIGAAHAFAPRRNHLLVRQQEIDVRITVGLLD